MRTYMWQMKNRYGTRLRHWFFRTFVCHKLALCTPKLIEWIVPAWDESGYKGAQRQGYWCCSRCGHSNEVYNIGQPEVSQ